MTAADRRDLPVVAVMARFPRPGEVKTRLVPRLGAVGASELHRELAAHCVSRLRPLYAAGDARIVVHHEGGSPRDVRPWLGSWPRIVPQPAGDLGARLRVALLGAVAAGAPSAVVVGSDCPAARSPHVRAALRSLETHDVVIGPAEDGGYWLLGVTAEAADRALSVLFEGIEWGGPDVFRQTMERASDAGLRVALAETLADVDRPEDIALWEIERAAEAEVPRSVTVVIPALDEAERVGDAVRSAIDGGADEVIVVDGGSRDLTRRVAEAAGAVVLESEPGRARQMNQGASAVTGDALVFLHADTRLPPGFAAAVRETLSLDGVSGGSFTWGTDDTPLAGLFNWVGRTRVTITHATYGDQGLFLRRSTFEDLGGYPDQPVMEDWELVRRLQRLGEFVVLPKRAMTSSRRYTERGVLSATAADIAVIAGYRLGMDPVRLDAWRRR